MSSQRVLNNLQRCAIRLLPTRVQSFGTPIVNGHNFVRGVDKVRNNVVNQRDATVRAHTGTLNIVHRGIRRAVDHVQLANRLRCNRYQPTTFNINKLTVVNKRKDRTPRANHTQRVKRRRQQRPDPERRKNSNTNARSTFPPVQPYNKNNIGGPLVSRFLPRFNRPLNTNVLVRVSNRNFTINQHIRQLAANRPSRHIVRATITQINNSVHTSLLRLFNNLMVIVPDLSLNNIRTNLTRRIFIMRRTRQTQVRKRSVNATNRLRKQPYTRNGRIKVVQTSFINRVGRLTKSHMLRRYVMFSLDRIQHTMAILGNNVGVTMTKSVNPFRTSIQVNFFRATSSLPRTQFPTPCTSLHAIIIHNLPTQNRKCKGSNDRYCNYRSFSSLSSRSRNSRYAEQNLGQWGPHSKVHRKTLYVE